MKSFLDIADSGGSSTPSIGLANLEDDSIAIELVNIEEGDRAEIGDACDEDDAQR